MPQCYVTSCSNYYGKTRASGKIIYHMLPTDPVMAAKWSKLCGYSNELPPSHARVCSDHFSPGCYQRDLQHELLGLPLRKKLKYNTVPDQNLPGRNAKIKKQDAQRVIRDVPELHSRRKRVAESTDAGTEGSKHRISVSEDTNRDKVVEPTEETRSATVPQAHHSLTSTVDLECQVLKNKNNVQQAKNNNRLNRRPMRSSIRIAKKKSIESLSDSFTSRINDENGRCAMDRPEWLSSKLQFMAKLQLKRGINQSVIDLDAFFNRVADSSGGKSAETRYTLYMQLLSHPSEKITFSYIVKQMEISALKCRWRHKNPSILSKCAVVGCNSTHRKTKGGPIRYHRFPGDSKTRSRWLQACGKQLNNCSTARVCSRHFRDESYERDVQHEILGLPARCRLKKGAVPEKNLPTDFLKEEEVPVSEYDILLAVGLVPTAQPTEMATGGLPEDLNKMQIMEDVREGCNVQPSSPGHADQRSDESQPKPKPTLDTGLVGERDTNEPPEDVKPDFDEKDVVKNGVVGEDLDGSMEIKEEQDATEENSMNAGSPVAESTNKRKSENEDYPVKRLRAEIHENFASRDKILNEFIEMAECNNLEQLQTFSEQLLAEVKTLNDLAKEKEREWNNVIHLKKLKEELLLRMQRKRQLMLMNANDKTDFSDLFIDSEDRSAENLPHSILKANLTSPKSALRIPSVSLNGNSVKQRNVLLKPQRESLELNGSQGKRLTLDVQSIIADYRQRHPEAVPRRGRRIRQSDGSHKYSNSILNFSSMALGSGSQVRQGSDVSNELNVLLNTINMNRQEGAGTRPPPTTADPSVSTSHDSVSFKDMLVQFARLSQSERNELIQNAIKPPPPYPEVTVHPVPTTSTPATPVAPSNSLLHGILTKTPPKQTVKSSFSPTLARLLTAPERAANNPVTSTPTSGSNAAMHPANMSITEILSGSKAHEITITPVETQFEATPIKSRNVEEEETEDSADRLVIDENNEAIDARKQSLGVDNTSEAGEEVPPCQGCNQKAAQFVCAGCGNQWYCSRDCQVSAWDEHSEVCSG